MILSFGRGNHTFQCTPWSICFHFSLAPCPPCSLLSCGYPEVMGILHPPWCSAFLLYLQKFPQHPLLADSPWPTLSPFESLCTANTVQLVQTQEYTCTRSGAEIISFHSFKLKIQNNL